MKSAPRIGTSSFRFATKLAVLFALAFTSVAQNRQLQPATPAQPQTSPETLNALRARILAHVSLPRFAPASWGVKVVSLDTGRTIFEHNAGKYFNPASNAKLYSTALALHRLGGDYRIRTSLYATARPNALGTIKGDLIIYGRGDPTFAARLSEGDYYKPLEKLISLLSNAGVRRIEGDLIGDESYFSGPPFGSGWEWDDLQWYYGAEVSALSINDNSLDLFVKPADKAGLPCRITTGPGTSFVTLMNRTQTVMKGRETRISVYRPVGENIIYVTGQVALGDRGYSGSVAIHDPAGLFAHLFKDALANRGITVTGRSRAIDWKYREVTPFDLSKLIELGSVESLSVSDIVRETLKPSQNLYAQLLLLQVGAATQSKTTEEQEPWVTTEDRGVKTLNEFLLEAGILRGDVLLEEGSGLSRRDIITPAATVELLRYMSKSRWAEAFRDGLPIAGVDGTLQNRMKGTPAAGNARAKTGSLRYVNALSGYVNTAAGERLAFSIMLNNYNVPRPVSIPPSGASSAPAASIPGPREDIDAIVVMLASFIGRSDG